MTGIPLLSKKSMPNPLIKGDIKYSSYYADSFKRLKKNKPAMVCLVIIILAFLSAIFAPIIVPYDPDGINLKQILQLPSFEHLFGTDEVGRDILSRVIYGGRVSLGIGLIAPFLTAFIGVLLGAMAGYIGGVVDIIISRFIELLVVFPALLLMMIIMLTFGPGMFSMIFAMAIGGWAGIARLIRGEVLSLRRREFVEACVASGGKSSRILLKHLIPNCLSSIIVMITMAIPASIVAEAGMSYLGLGIQAPMSSWGSMIFSAQGYLRQYPFYCLFAGLPILFMTVAFNMLGDGLRDALDPKLKNK